MFIIIPKKTSKIRDGYVITAIINFIGMIVVTAIIRSHVGWMSFLIMSPFYFYFGLTSISLALSRCWIIDRMNRLSQVIYMIAKQVVKTEKLLDIEKPRKLYQRRILLLEKHYKVHMEIFVCMNRALDKLKDMYPNTLQAVTDILSHSDTIAKKKIFLDKTNNL